MITTNFLTNLIATWGLARVSTDVPVRISVGMGDTVAVTDATYEEIDGQSTLVLRLDFDEFLKKFRERLTADSVANERVHDEIQAILGFWPNKERSCRALAAITGRPVSHYTAMKSDVVAVGVLDLLTTADPAERERMIAAFKSAVRR